ncbi:MAG: 6-phosphogluconolactonase [Clostridia bacterium]|nr:6-phosphogluconolactonase [Clostridia bacterium]
MRLKVFESPEALADRSAAWILEVIESKPDALCCFAAGFTQNQTYEKLARAVKRRHVPVDRLRIIGLDEWVSLDGGDEGSCRTYIDERIMRPLELGVDQMLMFFDGKAEPAAQCAHADSLLDTEGPIDLLVLGVGMNGHLGFNEPHSDLNLRAHLQALTETSIAAGQKYFPEARILSRGLTLGLHDLFKARRILVQAVGAHKAPVVKAILAGIPDPACPASLLNNVHATVYADKAARGCDR